MSMCIWAQNQLWFKKICILLRILVELLELYQLSKRENTPSLYRNFSVITKKINVVWVKAKYFWKLWEKSQVNYIF